MGLNQTSTRGGTAPCRDPTISARAPLMSARGTRLLSSTLPPTRARCLLPAAGKERCRQVGVLEGGQEPATLLVGHLSRAPAVSVCSETDVSGDDDCYSCQRAGVRHLHLHTYCTRRARRVLPASFHHEHALVNYVVVPGPLGVCQHHHVARPHSPTTLTFPLFHAPCSPATSGQRAYVRAW